MLPSNLTATPEQPSSSRRHCTHPESRSKQCAEAGPPPELPTRDKSDRPPAADRHAGPTGHRWNRTPNRRSAPGCDADSTAPHPAHMSRSGAVSSPRGTTERDGRSEARSRRSGHFC
jgi:hypothetical protein